MEAMVRVLVRRLMVGFRRVGIRSLDVWWVGEVRCVEAGGEGEKG